MRLIHVLTIVFLTVSLVQVTSCVSGDRSEGGIRTPDRTSHPDSSQTAGAPAEEQESTAEEELSAGPETEPNAGTNPAEPSSILPEGWPDSIPVLDKLEVIEKSAGEGSWILASGLVTSEEVVEFYAELPGWNYLGMDVPINAASSPDGVVALEVVEFVFEGTGESPAPSALGRHERFIIEFPEGDGEGEVETKVRITYYQY